MASLARAKTKFGEFIDILNDMITGHSEYNDFLLTKIKMGAKKLIQDDPAGAYILLGMIACVENDTENMHRNHKNAITLCNDFDTNTLYAISLLNADLFYEAYDIALKANKLCGDNIYDIFRITDILIQCCDFLNLDEEMDNYLQKWKKIKKEDHPLSFPEDNSDNLTEMFDYFDNIIDNYPDKIVRLDPEIVARAQKLVEGVELYAD